MTTDIFNAYAQLALEKGLIKSAASKAPEEKEGKALQKFRNSEYPRAGSDTIEVIEGLYNTKPKKPKSQEYKENIMEVAHPNKVILTPAYDKINALVENNIERQKIMINITQKPVNGLLTQHKYAEAELAKSLVAIATDLDNRNIEPLRQLADECIQDLHKQAFEWSDLGDFFKEKGGNALDIGKGTGSGALLGAIAGGLIGAFGGPVGTLAGAWAGAKGGALVGGLLTAIFNTSPQARNVSLNAKEAKEQLGDLLKDHKNDLFLTSLDTALAKIEETAEAYALLVDQMHLKLEDPKLQQSAHAVASAYQKQLEELDRLIEIFLQNAKMGRYAPEESDAWSRIKSPFSAMFGNDVSEAVSAMEVLERVNKIAIEGTKKAQGMAAQIPASVAPSPSPAPETGAPAKGSVEWWTQQLSTSP